MKVTLKCFLPLFSLWININVNFIIYVFPGTNLLIVQIPWNKKIITWVQIKYSGRVLSWISHLKNFKSQIYVSVSTKNFILSSNSRKHKFVY